MEMVDGFFFFFFLWWEVEGSGVWGEEGEGDEGRWYVKEIVREIGHWEGSDCKEEDCERLLARNMAAL